MNSLDKQYTDLLQEILDKGVEKNDRTGTGTISLFGKQIRHKMSEGFPLLTTKKMAFKSIVTELIWFLNGDTNIKYLVDNGCNIWNGDAYKKYVNSHTGQGNPKGKTLSEQLDCVIPIAHSKESFIEKIKNNDAKVGNLNYDQSGRAYPDNPKIKENWNCIWKNKDKYYRITGLPNHAEWEVIPIYTNEFANKWGDLGSIYGKQWRSWGGSKNSETKGILVKKSDGWYVKWSDLHSFSHGDIYSETKLQHFDQFNKNLVEGETVDFRFKVSRTIDTFAERREARLVPSSTTQYTGGIDQIANLIKDLKTNPDSRRLMVNAWNVGELDKMVLPPCFTSDMLVACIDGYRKISEITTNDLVLTEDGSYQKVYELHETKYNGNLLKIKTHANSKSINTTPNHPFLVRDKGYINASEITKNDYLGIPINKNEIIPSFKTIIKDNQYSEKEIETVLGDKDYWYLMGYFLGDGWLIDSKKEIYFTISNNQADEVLPRLNKIIGLAKLNNSGLNCKKYVGRKQQLFEILTMFGKYADGKFIPQFVHDAPNYLIEEFLKGYQRADGCITKDGINYSTVSDNIAYGLQLLYAKIKVKASVFYQKRPNKKIIESREVNQKNTYSINVYQQKNKSKNYIFDNNYLWLLVNDIETCNHDGYVYNISTQNNHTYNVFNLVNHNCHYGFQVNTRELNQSELNILYNKRRGVGEVDTKYSIDTVVAKDPNIPQRAISLMWNQRSVDTFLGLPFNIASYGLLLEILAKEVNMVPDELIGNLGDVHLYSNHIDQAREQIGRELSGEEIMKLYETGNYTNGGVKLGGAQWEPAVPTRTREPYPLPRLEINTEFWKTESGECGVGNFNTNLKGFEIDDFQLINYKSHSTIKAPLSN